MHIAHSLDPEFTRFSVDNLPHDLMQTAQYLSIKPGEIIFREGDIASSMYFLESGAVRLVNYTPSGKEIDHYSATEGEFFAEALMTMSVCSCTAIAEKLSRVLVIPKKSWLSALTTHQSLAVSFAGELSHRLHWLKLIIQLRGIKVARDRVWNYLQIIAPANSRIINLDKPLKAIAHELDLTPETLSRALKQLTSENLIKRGGQQITLLDS